MKQSSPDWFRPGTTIITASARLARRLSWQYTTARLAAGEQVWETPDILPWNAWVIRLWSTHQTRSGRMEILISGAQRRVMWQQIIEASPDRERLLQPVTVAQRALDAWQLLMDWGLPVFPDGVFLNEDARAFRSWAQGYGRRCVQGHWLDEATLPAELARIYQQEPPPDRCPLVLVGFDDLVPVRQRLLDVLTLAGVPVSRPAHATQPGHRVRCSFNDTRAEAIAAASWARGCLERNPGASIGMVVPGLQSLRAPLEAILDDILVPDALLADPDGAQRVYSIALGQPLTCQPVIEHALLLLALAAGSSGINEVAAVLRSPYLRGSETEAAPRALLDARLRRKREPELGLDTLLQEGTRSTGSVVPPAILLEGLGAVRRRSRELPRRQGAAAWAQSFSDLLKEAGWPGDRALASSEYQALSAWRDALGDLVSLDPVAGPMSYSTALAQLRRLATEQTYQPKTTEAPIQILEFAGVADMQFDHLWVMGLHEEVWPRPAQPNPFIPLPFQRELGLPRSGAEVELAHARRITDALLASSGDVVFSWPEHDGERPLRPSALILDLEVAAPALRHFPTWIWAAHSARAAEHFSDDTGPALTAGAEVRGGAALFKDQAACPFRAFARHRLRAEALDQADVGLDAMERGNLVHKVLQILWQRLRTHAALLAMSETELTGHIEQAVDQSLAPLRARRPQTFTPRFTAVERSRLCSLAREWLLLERERAPFEVVACEQARPFRLGNIEGQLRVDRLDRLADGGLLIMDYKTGKVSARHWDGTRPEDPQLPLYAVTADEAVAALTFARLRRGDLGFEGIAAAAHLMPGVREAADWGKLLGEWRATLTALAAEIEQGHAAVAPKSREQTCRYCDLHTFCRIHEFPERGDEEEDAG